MNTCVDTQDIKIGATAHAVFYQTEEGIVIIELEKGVLLDKAEVVEHFNFLNSKLHGKPAAILIDTRFVGSTSRDAQVFLSSREMSEKIIANAILVESAISRILATFYISIRRPSFPIKLFNRVDEAKKWLRQFVKQ